MALTKQSSLLGLMYFCVNNCTSPSKDYAAVARTNQFLTDLQTFDQAYSYFKMFSSDFQRDRKWAWPSKNFQTRLPFLNF